MQTEPLYEWPARAKTIVKKAHDSGWTTRTTWADGPPQNICVRFFRDGFAAVYAIWLGNSWGWARTQTGKALKQGQLISYLEGTYVPDADSDGEPGGVEGSDPVGDAQGQPDAPDSGT